MKPVRLIAKEDSGWQRRQFLKTVGLAGGTALMGSSLAATAPDPDDDPVGILIDTTRCVGCRSCEVACAEANGLPEPDLDDDSVFQGERTPSENHFTVVNYYDTEAGEITVKKQCMHCLQPACAAACLTKAMLKTDEGPVIWRQEKCMGCRYCMVSCPFDVPKFEYDSAVPRIRKCAMCWNRLAEGQKPACVENCPAEALTYGKRNALLDEARSRIYSNPDDYVHHIYGEHEAGGTSVLYLASVPFEQLGFRTDLETRAYPELTKEFLYGVPVVLLLWPAFLLAMNRAVPSGDGTESEG